LALKLNTLADPEGLAPTSLEPEISEGVDTAIAWRMISSHHRLPARVMCHGRPTLRLAQRLGWLPGARYTNLRDLRGFNRVGLIDVDWVHYDFARHLRAVKATRPLLTIARDITDARNLDETLSQASELAQWADHVVVVPKDTSLRETLTDRIPESFLLGYSVPTLYGATRLPLKAFRRRRVHLLGGRPDVQLRLARHLNVFSLDGNRITYDAQFGDCFAGNRFTPHPTGGYYECIRDSLILVNSMWSNRTKLTAAAAVVLAGERHLADIKELADRHRRELGFVLRPAIAESVRHLSVLVSLESRKVTGYLRFRHRRDRVTKIYELCVSPESRRRGVASSMVRHLVDIAASRGQVSIQLKCPLGEMAEKFYSSFGFERVCVESGKSRPLGRWTLRIEA
jgi:ribosomal protein S18 acetylase RimI-like enzyme